MDITSVCLFVYLDNNNKVSFFCQLSIIFPPVLINFGNFSLPVRLLNAGGGEREHQNLLKPSRGATIDKLDFEPRHYLMALLLARDQLTSPQIDYNFVGRLLCRNVPR